MRFTLDGVAVEPHTAEPLVLRPGQTLCGDGACTIIRQPIIIEGGLTPSPGRGIPDRTVLRDFTLDGEGLDINTGMLVWAANVKIERVTIRGCYHGIVVRETVNSVIRDCLIVHNQYGIYIPPYNVVTTLSLSGNNIRENAMAGLSITTGQGIRLVDQNIVEANGRGMVLVDERGPMGLLPVISEGTWFEQNREPNIGEAEWLRIVP